MVVHRVVSATRKSKDDVLVILCGRLQSPYVIDLIVNLTGFRVTKETSFWVCQGGLAKLGS